MKKQTILKFVFGTIVLIFMCTGLFLKTRENGTIQKEKIKIGIIYPLTGPASFFGTGAKNAVALFQDHMNSMNLKYNYEFIFEDSQAQASIGVSAAMKLINLNRVDVIVDSFSGVAIAIGNLTEKAKIPHFSLAQSKKISQGFYNWRVTTSENKTGEALYHELRKRGFHDLIVIRKNAEGPLSNYNGFIPFVNQDAQIAVRKIYDYNPNERDFRIMLYKIKQDHPQAILLLAEKPDIDLILKQMKELEINVPIASIFSLIYVQDRSLAEGVWQANVSTPAKEWTQAYETKFGGDTNMAEWLYSILQIISTVYESSDVKLTGTEVMNRLKMVDGLQTPLGAIIYDAPNQVLDTHAEIQEMKNGQLIPIESEVKNEN